MSFDTETFDQIGRSPYGVFQAAKGYRFSTDPILLAAFSRPQSGDRVVDLGAGSGVVPLLLKWYEPEIEILGIEIQASMVERARRSLRQNHVVGIELRHGDVRDYARLIQEGQADLVTANPPYRDPSHGRPAPGSERNQARFELAGGAAEFVRAAHWALRTGGRCCMVYLAERMLQLIDVFRDAGLTPTRLRQVQPFDDHPARLILLEGVKGGHDDLTELPPLVMYGAADRQGRGTPTAALLEVYNRGAL